MAKVTAADVNKLRKLTGSGMMDCKNALVEAEGDFDKAIEILRKKGQKVAAKRADRESSEGAAIAKVNADSSKGVIISLNCETDFVAKNEGFIQLANEIAELALQYDSLEALLEAAYNDQISVQEKLTEQTGVIGEKIEVGAFKTLSAPFVGSYIHAGNKIAALTGLTGKNEEVAKDISMQVAAMGAEVLSYKEFDAEYVERETEARIAEINKLNEELVRLNRPTKNIPQYVSYSQLTEEVMKQAEEEAKKELQAEGKPEKIWDKIIPGKIQRFISDNTSLDQEKALLNQNFIKDDSKKVEDYVKEHNVEITGFERISLA